MRIAAGIEYDGTGFHGWQCQTGVRTVQTCVEQAISKVADHDVRVVTAGRTDTGVHATGQVVHFDSEAVRSDYSWRRGINTHLPDDIGMPWIRPVADSFHARFSAVERSYRYIIYNRSVPSALLRWKTTWEYRELDVERMNRAARGLIGEHDFSAFRAAGCQAASPVRTITHIEVDAVSHWVWIDVSANAFLQHMVRNIAGVLISIGSGERAIEWMNQVLASRDRTRGGVTAPPHGLYLTAVRYPDPYGLPPAARGIQFW